MNRAIALTGASLEIAGSLSGIPFVGAAAILLNEIVACCEDIQVKKQQARQLANQCARLITTLEDYSSKLTGTELQQAVDELQPVLENILKRVKQWSRYNRVQCFIWNGDIEKGIDQCKSELSGALSIFNVNAQIIGNTLQRETIEFNRAHTADIQELREMIGNILTSRQDMSQVVEMQANGEHAAEIVMQAAQQELRDMREAAISHADARLELPILKTGERYLEYQRSLMNLHRITGLPPSVKILNGEITKAGDLAVAGGAYSDVWKGKWLGEEEVALKALRNVRSSDRRARQRFEREINLWAELKHGHILPFYGIVTDLGNHIHMVSPWQANGNALEYTIAHPDVDRLRLLKGAALGLEYLHNCNIVHGNVKCANILVSASSEARICDFGMSKIIEEVTEQAASVTLTTSGSARWLAPELIEGNINSPTKATDSYAFAMTALELLTGKHPYANQKRNAAVIHEKVVKRLLPPRPRDDDADKWISNDLWGLMLACWQPAEDRPSLTDIRSHLQKIYSA
ncbi:kinase-like protein [Pleurotus eryngii]|uniref:Kinase-like protein n=1 Tax=Pleurotus eryngii TaxID=5323 RepID=A0A9P5ZXD0_PLEER|nr:kinase-like protein [Pleurotus eryngii]